MKKLSEEIVQFLHNQGVVIVSTIDKDESLHSACKGIVNIDNRGKVYLLDLYKARTYENLMRDPRISITVADEHKFIGYCLKGKAKLVKREDVKNQIIKSWEDRITSTSSNKFL